MLFLMSGGHPALAGSPVVATFPLLWGDQDKFGHVNNVVYLRWAETARVEYLARIGLWDAMLSATSVGPILASISCDYRRPLTYPDTVHVDARVTYIGTSSFRMRHRIVSERLGAVVAEVDSTVVAFDYKRAKSVPLPPDSRRAIEALEGRAFDAGTNGAAN